MLINLDDCEGMDMKLCQLAKEENLTDEQYRYFTKGWQALWGMIIGLPPAEKTARWVHSTVYVDQRGCAFPKCKCSNCEHEEFAISDNVTQGNYCPNCGARMRELNTEFVYEYMCRLEGEKNDLSSLW